MSDVARILDELSTAVKSSAEMTNFTQISKKVDDDVNLQADFKFFETTTETEEKSQIHEKIMKNPLFLEYINAKNELDLLKNNVFNTLADAFGLTKKGDCGSGCGGCGGCGNH